jgi:GNAT superfamily N-acetyltransferase
LSNITVSRKNNPEYEPLFDNLIQDVFGFSFAPWLKHQLWDERYTSYSIIQNGIMISNICIYKTDLLINGKTIRAHQIGGVATRENERGKGHMRLLMEHIMNEYPSTPAFLAANPRVIDFYPRFGFKLLQTYRPKIDVAINNRPTESVKFKPDDYFLHNLIHGKRIYSQILDCLNTQPIQKFHMLMDYPEGIYYLQSCDAIAIAEQNGDRLFLADVIAKEPITFDQLVKELPFTGVKCIEFGFCPDWLLVNPDWEPENMDEEPFFIKGNWELPKIFRFPTMSQT